jgi:TRAP-type C4-dicarboxylate transport system permease small subunit
MPKDQRPGGRLLGASHSREGRKWKKLYRIIVQNMVITLRILDLNAVTKVCDRAAIGRGAATLHVPWLMVDVTVGHRGMSEVFRDAPASSCLTIMVLLRSLPEIYSGRSSRSGRYIFDDSCSSVTYGPPNSLKKTVSPHALRFFPG